LQQSPLDYFASYQVEVMARYMTTAPQGILDFGGGALVASISMLMEFCPGSAIPLSDPSTKSLEVARLRFLDLPAAHIGAPPCSRHQYRRWMPKYPRRSITTSPPDIVSINVP
jgi:hypothetical protein